MGGGGGRRNGRDPVGIEEGRWDAVVELFTAEELVPIGPCLITEMCISESALALVAPNASEHSVTPP